MIQYFIISICIRKLVYYIQILLMFALKIARTFGKVKPLKGIGSSTDTGFKFVSQTETHQFEIHNPLQTLVGALVACQLSTLRGLTRDGKVKINKFDVKKMESSYKLQNFMKGGKQNTIDAVTIQAEIDTDGTQAQIDELEKKVEKSCPIHCMLSSAGVKISNKWTKAK